VLSSRACIYLDGVGGVDAPCTSGSMVNLGIEEDAEEQWHYDPYAGAVVRDDAAAAQYRANFEEVEAIESKRRYDIFTVTPTPDVIVVRNEEEELRSRSLSPSIICHHVIDELADSEDEQDEQTEHDTGTQLNAKQLVSQVYSPTLTKRSLLDIGSQLEHEHEEAKSRSPSPYPASERPSSGVSACSNESSIDLPVIRRKQRRKTSLRPSKSLDTTQSSTSTETMSSVKSPRSLVNTAIPPHSPKGKATQGSCIKSSKNIPKHHHAQRTRSNDSDPHPMTHYDSEIELKARNPYSPETEGAQLETSINASTMGRLYHEKSLQRQSHAIEEHSDWDSDSLAGELEHNSHTSQTFGDKNLVGAVGKDHVSPAPHPARRHLPPTGSYTDDHETASDWDSDVSGGGRDMIRPQRSLDTCDSRCS
jgi:hypothetical protein